MSQAILRMPDVKKVTGLSRSTIYLRIRQGLFTSPVGIGANSVGWPSYELDAINASFIAGKPDDEIRALVSKLHSQRAQAA